jgi:hypothetical protein
MAHETGTATDAEDLFDKLIAFLTTNADLVTDGEEWTEDWTAPGGAPNETARVLTGSVPAGDPPKIAMQLVAIPATSQFEIQFNGLTNVLTSAILPTDHANSSQQVRLFLDDNPMTYWFTASGRRFIVVVKISTVFESAYCGLFLPYALPNTYPYPIYIAASAGLGSNQPADWRSLANSHASLALPSRVDGTGPTFRPCTAFCLSPAAQWEEVTVPSTDNVATSALTGVMLHPFYDGGFVAATTETIAGQRLYADDALALQVEGPADVFAVHAVTLFRRTPANQAYGILDGVVAVQGRNNAAENEITVGAVDYLVVQDTFRTTLNRYFAVLKE